MISLHLLLILIAFICALLSAFGIGARVNLFALAFALFLLDMLIR